MSVPHSGLELYGTSFPGSRVKFTYRKFSGETQEAGRLGINISNEYHFFFLNSIDQGEALKDFVLALLLQ